MSICRFTMIMCIPEVHYILSNQRHKAQVHPTEGVCFAGNKKTAKRARSGKLCERGPREGDSSFVANIMTKQRKLRLSRNDEGKKQTGHKHNHPPSTPI